MPKFSKMMKVQYITPITEEVKIANGEVVLKFTGLTDASNPAGPGTGAPSRVMDPSLF